MLLGVFGCFMYMLLYPWKAKKSFREVIDKVKDPLSVPLCLSKCLYKRDFDHKLVLFADSVPRHTTHQGVRRQARTRGSMERSEGSLEYTTGLPILEVRQVLGCMERTCISTLHYQLGPDRGQVDGKVDGQVYALIDVLA